MTLQRAHDTNGLARHRQGRAVAPIADEGCDGVAPAMRQALADPERVR